MSIPQAAAVSFPREEALLIASLLALTGGYLDAYTWIVHAQTANLVFLWVYMTGGMGRALPMSACARYGVVLANSPRPRISV